MLTKRNLQTLNKLYRIIELNKRCYAKVDELDYKWLMSWRWRLRRSGHCFYATRRVKHDGKEKIIKMHRAIMKPQPDKEVHHINHNCLDNRRENLLVCSPDQHKQIHRMG